MVCRWSEPRNGERTFVHLFVRHGGETESFGGDEDVFWLERA